MRGLIYIICFGRVEADKKKLTKLKKLKQNTGADSLCLDQKKEEEKNEKIKTKRKSKQFI